MSALLPPWILAMARKLADSRHLAFVVERRALLVACAPVHALEGQIAADEQTALPGERLIERGAERADGGNGGDAERDADHEDGEAAGAGAKLAKGNRERKRQMTAACRPGRSEIGCGHEAAARRLAPPSSPGRRRGLRCGRSAWRAQGHG